MACATVDLPRGVAGLALETVIIGVTKLGRAGNCSGFLLCPESGCKGYVDNATLEGFQNAVLTITVVGESLG